MVAWYAARAVFWCVLGTRLQSTDVSSLHRVSFTLGSAIHVSPYSLLKSTWDLFLAFLQCSLAMKTDLLYNMGCNTCLCFQWLLSWLLHKWRRLSVVTNYKWRTDNLLLHVFALWLYNIWIGLLSILRLQFCYFLIVMATLTSALVLAARKQDPRLYNKPVDIFRGLCEVIAALLLGYYGISEINQLRM